MKTRCEGCGVKIQTTDPKMPGYIRSDVYLKNPDNFLCERCFNIQHYNKNIKVTIDEKEFYENAERISKTDGIIVNIIDAFDLDGTLIKDINKIFPNNKIILIANKYDLFLRSNRPTKIRRYIYDYLLKNNISVDNVIVTSAKEQVSAKKIIETLEEESEGKEIYFFGVANVGKSTLINSLMTAIDENNKYHVTVSNTPGTTLDNIKVVLPNGLIVNDTPGILTKHQISSYVEGKSLDRLLPKKFVKPRVFQLNPKQTLFLGGFAWINFLEGERSSFVTYVSNNVVVHRTKLENANEFFKEHADDILRYPTLKERKKLGKMKVTTFEFEGKKEISISGLGFIGLNGIGKVSVVTYENIAVNMREPLI